MTLLLADHWVVENWVGILAAAVAIYVFGVPLLVLGQFHHEAHPTVQRVEPHMLPLPEPVAEHLNAVAACLEPEGFEARGVFLLPHPAKNVSVFLALFVNQSTVETAFAVSAVARGDGNVVVAEYVEINTYFTTGREINTGNLTDVPAYRAPRNTLTTHVPWIADPVELCEIHRAIVSAKGDSAPTELRIDTQFDGDAAAYLSGLMHEELEAAVHDGFLRLDGGGAHYRPTLRGAYLMTWKQIPPFARFVMRARDRRSTQVLEDVGMA